MSGTRTTRALVAGTLLAVVMPAAAAMAAGGTTTGADLQVSGSASTGSPSPASPYAYTFQIKNSGPGTATGVVFNDPLPTGTTYNYATASGSTLPCVAIGNLNGGASASCTLGDIVKGGQATVVVNVNAPLAASTYADTGSVSSTSTDPVLTNNAATVTVQVKAAAAGGGGVNKGGVNDPAAPPPSAAPCAAIANVSAPVGYYSTFAAIWNTFTVRSCSSSTETVNVEVSETNTATGTIDYDAIYPASLLAAQNTSVVLDNDFAPFNTTYTIAFTATDVSGNVLATASVIATTPPPQ